MKNRVMKELCLCGPALKSFIELKMRKAVVQQRRVASARRFCLLTINFFIAFTSILAYVLQKKGVCLLQRQTPQDADFTVGTL